MGAGSDSLENTPSNTENRNVPAVAAHRECTTEVPCLGGRTGSYSSQLCCSRFAGSRPFGRRENAGTQEAAHGGRGAAAERRQCVLAPQAPAAQWQPSQRRPSRVRARDGAHEAARARLREPKLHQLNQLRVRRWALVVVLVLVLAPVLGLVLR